MADPQNFSDLRFEDFRRLAADASLSKYERIGFPDSYRKGFEAAIFEDIKRKLPALDGEACRVVDIGPGCSDLPQLLIEQCRARGHSLSFVDSPEMLALLPDAPFLEKTEGMFPNTPELLSRLRGSVDVVLSYSVLQYVFVDTPLFGFFDACLSLLAPRGRLLLGDIPNVSKRKRFFASETGARFHQEFQNTAEKPAVSFNTLEEKRIDDAVVLALVSRARAAGFDSYVLPQDPALPMSNRREDLLFVRP